jgi:hypothetical protein
MCLDLLVGERRVIRAGTMLHARRMQPWNMSWYRSNRIRKIVMHCEAWYGLQLEI